MTSSTSPGFRLARGPRILARTAEAEVPVAEFPATGNRALDALRPMFARLRVAALSSAFSPEGAAAIGARRGADSVHAQAARENRALLRGSVAADAVDRYVAALSAGADPEAAREAAVAAPAEPLAELAPAVETVWNLARECVAAWPELDGDDPVSGADVVEWLAGMRGRFRRALQLRPR